MNFNYNLLFIEVLVKVRKLYEIIKGKRLVFVSYENKRLEVSNINIL